MKLINKEFNSDFSVDQKEKIS